MHVHDRGYKKLFSNRIFFQQLMETFVKEGWVTELDFSTCETIDKSFLSADYDQTTSDLLYKVKLQGRDAYIAILIEFQSTVDRFMVLRTLNYITNFYMDYVQSQRESKEAEPGYKLPAIFPIVLYNGEESWTAPTQMADLIEPYPKLGDYGIGFQYFKISENEFDKEGLLKIRNLVSTLFLAEAHYDIELLQEELLSLFTEASDKTAISLLLNWFKQLWANDRITEEDYSKLDYVYHSVKEVRTMLMTAIANEKRESFEQGVEQGIEQGVEQGIEQGICMTLLRLITFRYHPQETEIEWIKKQLQQISSIETLTQLTDLCLDTEEFTQFKTQLGVILAQLNPASDK